MKKLINKPENIVPELLQGLTLAYSDWIKLTDDYLVVRAQPKAEGKVGLVTPYGSGHEPGLSGFVGMGMLDVGVPGEIFAAPAPDRCVQALKLADRGGGVLLVVCNHEGDVLSGTMALEKALAEGVNARMLLFGEDISTGPRDHPEDRRGLAGYLPLLKMLGAAAERNSGLDELYVLGERFAQQLGTLAVAIRSGTHPLTGQEFFFLGDDEIGIGMGVHGEEGTARLALSSADELADYMLTALVTDIGLVAGDQVIAVLNGAGSTTLMELFIIFRRVYRTLAEQGITIARSRIGEFHTTQEQAGFSITLGQVDEELLALWDAPCDTPYLAVL